jgi:hypothetical protein
MFVDEILVQSQLFQLWFWWLVLINSFAIIFAFTENEARWIMLTWLVHIWSLVLYESFIEQMGYTRFVGLSQIVLWTPMMIYLALRIRLIAWGSVYGRYLALLMLSNGIALMLDYRAFILWLLGERAAEL